MSVGNVQACTRTYPVLFIFFAAADSPMAAWQSAMQEWDEVLTWLT